MRYHSFFPHMTPMEHVDFLYRYFERFDPARFYQMLTYFEIDRDKKIRTFSKGQKSKFEVVLGLCKGAKYILMDEPFQGKNLQQVFREGYDYDEKKLLKLIK